MGSTSCVHQRGTESQTLPGKRLATSDPLQFPYNPNSLENFMEPKVSIQWSMRTSGRPWYSETRRQRCQQCLHVGPELSTHSASSQLQLRIPPRFLAVTSQLFISPQPRSLKLLWYLLPKESTLNMSLVSSTIQLYTYNKAMFGGNQRALWCLFLSTFYTVQQVHTINDGFVLSQYSAWEAPRGTQIVAESSQTWCDGELST